ncbi:MAG: hypothetical protein WAM90_01525 [Rhodanobacter sp.]
MTVDIKVESQHDTFLAQRSIKVVSSTAGIDLSNVAPQYKPA